MTKLKFIEPVYASSVEKLPEGRDWLYEIKLDGYRCLAGRNSKGVILWSRRANIFTTQFPRITRACEKLQPDTLIDGEIVAIDASGRPSFNLLQHHRSKASAIQFYAFDILFDRGRSLLEVPLETRRELLNEALHAVSDPIRLSEAFETTPADLIRAAKEQSLEGIIAKRKILSMSPAHASADEGHKLTDPVGHLQAGNYISELHGLLRDIHNTFSLTAMVDGVNDGVVHLTIGR